MAELLAAIAISSVTIWICWFIGEKVDDSIKAKEEIKKLQIEKTVGEKFVLSVLEFVDNLILHEKIKKEDRDFVIRAIIYREAKEDLVYRYIDILDEIETEKVEKEDNETLE